MDEPGPTAQSCWDYCVAHPTETVDDIARRFGMARSTMVRLFSLAGLENPRAKECKVRRRDEPDCAGLRLGYCPNCKLTPPCKTWHCGRCAMTVACPCYGPKTPAWMAGFDKWRGARKTRTSWALKMQARCIRWSLQLRKYVVCERLPIS